MAINPKLLSEGEHVVVETRTHWKVLVVPALGLIVTCAVAGFLFAVLPSGGAHDPLMWAIIVVAVLVLIWWTLRSFVIWLSSEYTITNRRIINRTGIITRKGR